MMATVLAVPSFAFAAEEEATAETTAAETAAAENTDTEPAVEESTAVQGVKVTVVSKTSLKIKWKKVKGADGYRIYSYDTNTGKFKKVKTIKKGSKKKYTVKKLTSNKRYYFAVASYEKVNGKKVYSDKSEVVSAKTPKKITPKTKGFSKTPAGIVRNAAKAKKGCAYVHGCEGPNAFDCSGFVWWVYNKSKKVKKLKTKKFTRGSAKSEYQELRKYNIGRNLKNAQPGDIVFYARNGRTSSIHHVAIFYGNGKVIHASTPATGVIVTKATYSGPVAAIVRMPGF